MTDLDKDARIAELVAALGKAKRFVQKRQPNDMPDPGYDAMVSLVDRALSGDGSAGAKVIQAARADDIRAQGWAVAVHNDYRLNGESYTFWLFTRDGRAIKGEGRTDAEALDQVRIALDAKED